MKGKMCFNTILCCTDLKNEVIFMRQKNIFLNTHWSVHKISLLSDHILDWWKVLFFSDIGHSSTTVSVMSASRSWSTRPTILATIWNFCSTNSCPIPAISPICTVLYSKICKPNLSLGNSKYHGKKLSCLLLVVPEKNGVSKCNSNMAQFCLNTLYW